MALVGNPALHRQCRRDRPRALCRGRDEEHGHARQGRRIAAGRNHHWTKSLVASEDGSKLYVGVGSNSNVGENGMPKEEKRAAVLEIDAATGATQIFASGLRNPVGIDWNRHEGTMGRGSMSATKSAMISCPTI